jgi:hypothetical protein
MIILQTLLVAICLFLTIATIILNVVFSLHKWKWRDIVERRQGWLKFLWIWSKFWLAAAIIGAFLGVSYTLALSIFGG